MSYRLKTVTNINKKYRAPTFVVTCMHTWQSAQPINQIINFILYNDFSLYLTLISFLWGKDACHINSPVGVFLSL